MKSEHINLFNADCLDALRELPENSIDSIVTDPPYGLAFMGKKWDYQVPSVAIWEACLRVLKPGGHLVAFASSRTQHRMAVNIEDAGFEIRDMLAWVYGSGFPKSMNLATAANDDEFEGWGTALKPALEPITLARKPFAGTLTNNVIQFKTGGLNIDACRIISTGERPGGNPVNPSELGRWPANLMHDGSAEVVAMFPSKAGAAAPVRGNEPSGVTNGIYNAFAGRVPGAFYGDTGSAARFFYCPKASKADRDAGLEGATTSAAVMVNRKENSAGMKSPRAGAGRTNGAKNFHPTVKPVQLMRWLVRLVTPKGGKILDPFMGSGTTGIAAIQEGFEFVGIERETQYFELAQSRVNAA